MPQGHLIAQLTVSTARGHAPYTRAAGVVLSAESVRKILVFDRMVSAEGVI